MNITQQDFEKYISVAAFATTEIYDKIKNELDSAYLDCHVDYLGTAAGKVVEEGSNPSLTFRVKQYVCLKAFLTHLHDLDLVLTPTGFGVVSSESVAPASKARVDALENTLTLLLLRVTGSMLMQLREIDGWGESEQARQQIRYTFFCINQLDKLMSHEATVNDWNTLHNAAVEVDTELRKLINGKQMDEILKHVRHAVSNADDTAMNDAAALINDIIYLHAWHSPAEDDKKNELLQYIEDDADAFSIYMGSTNYKANHYKGYENKQNDTAYIAKG